MNILGLSAFYHDSAACLVRDGEIIAAAQEERFTRKRHDAEFPKLAVEYCLQEAGIKVSDLDYVGFYDKPFVKFERILETYLSIAPTGLKQFLSAIPIWLKDKLWTRENIRKHLDYSGPILFSEHHESHAASAFYPSPFQEAAVLTMDGVGEWATTSIGVGKGNQLDLIQELSFPHSLGLLYSAFTYYLGFKVNSGEYKVMGLAPYGEPKYVNLIRDNLIDLKEDGSFRMDMRYFNFLGGLTMTNSKLDKLMGAPARKQEAKLTQREMDIAASLQVVTEEVMLKMARYVRRSTGMKSLCLAGGVALNCVGNGKILKEKVFDDIWIQPAAGDAGGAAGVALCIWHKVLKNERKVVAGKDAMKGSYLGPGYDSESIQKYLGENNIPYKQYGETDLIKTVVGLLQEEKVAGWFQGRMEFGPRSLGGRSIIGDPRSTKMQSIMNLKIKFRESFRPFAPSVQAEKVSDWFEMDSESPYMLLVAPIREDKRIALTEEQKKLFGIDLLNVPRSQLPSITHVDYSARVQTVVPDYNPRFYNLLKEFGEATDCPVLINTSFNVRGEPIVCTPQQAYMCFMRTGMDFLVLEDCVLLKAEQTPLEDDSDWRNEFELD
ncbi:MAG: carbamoyltransferase [Nitrospinae bacterium]|jgi:carbamoyltransferase|nr:carbamoyltransferase [Nitrospinota bacterium]MDA1109737.1 carbamoyltransferase [Nitrospinota bacterium]